MLAPRRRLLASPGGRSDERRSLERSRGGDAGREGDGIGIAGSRVSKPRRLSDLPERGISRRSRRVGSLEAFPHQRRNPVGKARSGIHQRRSPIGAPRRAVRQRRNPISFARRAIHQRRNPISFARRAIHQRRNPISFARRAIHQRRKRIDEPGRVLHQRRKRIDEPGRFVHKRSRSSCRRSQPPPQRSEVPRHLRLRRCARGSSSYPARGAPRLHRAQRKETRKLVHEARPEPRAPPSPALRRRRRHPRPLAPAAAGRSAPAGRRRHRATELAPPRSAATIPRNCDIDPRTMEILHESTGWPGDLDTDLQPGLAALPAGPGYPIPAVCGDP